MTALHIIAAIAAVMLLGGIGLMMYVIARLFSIPPTDYRGE